MPPDSERLVFQLLSEDPAAEGWVVLHSVRPNPAYSPGRRQRRRPQVDFLVLVPNVAILCLEVKGGGFRVQNGKWYPEAAEQPDTPPVEQAEYAMYMLRNEVAGRFGGEWGNVELPIDCVVIFTDTNWPAGIRPPEKPVIELPSLLQQGAKTLAERLVEIARSTRNEVPGTPLRLDMPTTGAIQQWFAPDTVLTTVARPVPYASAERRLIRLTEEQYQALQTADENDRSLFSGGAGTGKTMLAPRTGAPTLCRRQPGCLALL